ncbi:MAG: 6-carboxytetrahydropterin synthase [Planctomycetes bacterium]|nr:6-carboxytetrahydropterin synthase [Planctomycetota bacterium]
MITITRRIEFCAAHRLHNPDLSDAENKRIYGVCNNKNGHGHNYAIEVTVRGALPRKTGMVMDLKDLNDILQKVIHNPCDHKHLNHDVAMFESVIPTAENMAIKFWEAVDDELQQYHGVHLHLVRVIESRNNFVDYTGPDPGDIV